MSIELVKASAESGAVYNQEFSVGSESLIK